jgi:hypothetical protein
MNSSFESKIEELDLITLQKLFNFIKLQIIKKEIEKSKTELQKIKEKEKDIKEKWFLYVINNMNIDINHILVGIEKKENLINLKNLLRKYYKTIDSKEKILKDDYKDLSFGKKYDCCDPRCSKEDDIIDHYYYLQYSNNFIMCPNCSDDSNEDETYEKYIKEDIINEFKAFLLNYNMKKQ